jgi:hypothetical protein
MLCSSFRYCSAGVLCLAALVFTALSGCSDPGVKKVTLKGTVAYKGQPLSSGSLRLVGPEGTASASPIKGDGTFVITDVVPGEVKIAVLEGPPQGAKSSGPKAAPVALPEKYRDPLTSGVTHKITPDMKELHIDLP